MPNETTIHVGGQTLSADEDVIRLRKEFTPLPRSIEGGKGTRAEVVSDEITVAADRYLKATELEQQSAERPAVGSTAVSGQAIRAVPVHIARGGNPVFSGSLLYSGTSIEEGGSGAKDHTYEMTGDGLELWPLLEGVSLRDLDLGTIEWTREACEASWSGSVDSGWNAIFAPAIYGDLRPKGEDGKPTQDFNRFTHRDLRPQVYFYAIVKAIMEGVAGYRIVSEFFETPAFKACVHTFGVGDAMEVTALDGGGSQQRTVSGSYYNQQVLNSAQILPFSGSSPDPVAGSTDNANGRITIITPGTYRIEVYAESRDGALREIQLRGPGESVLRAAVASEGVVSEVYNILLNAGDTLRMFAVIDGRTVIDYASLTATINLSGADAGSAIDLSTCLPDKGVKDFLRGISHLFNLEWGVDAVLRTVRVEPRFAYRLDGADYPGFYDLVNVRDPIGSPDGGKAVRVERITGYQGYLELGYKDSYSGLAEYFQNERPDPDGVAFSGIRFYDGSGLPPGANSHSHNPYFEAIVSEHVAYFSTFSQLPHLWKSIGDDGDPNPDLSGSENGGTELKAPTYEFPPSCGIIQPRSAFILWEDVEGTLPVPLMTQRYGTDGAPIGLDLSYGTAATFNPERAIAAQNVPSLGTTFYPHLAATLMRGRAVTVQANVLDPVAVYTETAQRAFALDYTGGCHYPALLTGISGYSPAAGSAKLSYLTFVAASAQDSLQARHYRFRPTIEKPGGQTCSYSFVDELPHANGPRNTIIAEIRLQNGYVLPLGYPYQSAKGPSEAARLKADLERIIALAGYTTGGVSASVVDEGTFDGWRITIAATRLWLRGLWQVNAGGLYGQDFETSDCY